MYPPRFGVLVLLHVTQYNVENISQVMIPYIISCNISQVMIHESCTFLSVTSPFPGGDNIFHLVTVNTLTRQNCNVNVRSSRVFFKKMKI
jgi:hypothetical protein